MQKTPEKRSRTVWLVLAAPPLLFFLLLVAASVYFGFVTQGDAEAIAQRVPRSLPLILLLLQIGLLFLLALALKKDRLTLADIGWRLPEGKTLWSEALLGGLLGAGLGLLYPYALAPLLEFLQGTVGDYVPPGEILPTLSAYLVPFFLANVLLAPFTEESLYRGYALTQLGGRYRPGQAALLTGLFFGLLHWPGGLWYMALTGGFLGLLLAGLFLWRKNLIAPFALHLVLNLMEFLFALQGG